MVNTNRLLTPQPVVPAGMCLVADAVEAAGHTVEVLDLCFSASPGRALCRSILRFSPDVLGMSVRNLDNSDSVFPNEYVTGVASLVEEARRVSSARIVLGGPAASIAPTLLLERTGADYAVVGEGESAFQSLLQMIEQSDAEQVRVVVADVGGAGFHSEFTPGRFRNLHVGSYAARGASAPLQSKRGCCHRCVYCTYPGIEGCRYRMKPAVEVVDEIRAIRSLGRFRSAEFVDSVFNEPLEYAISLCDEIARGGNRFPLHTTTVNPSNAPASLFRSMQRAGFTAFACSLESASDEVLARLDKGFTASEVHGTVRAARLTEMARMWVFMLGGPGETERTARMTLDFITRYLGNRDLVFLTCGVRIYPGTRLEQIARDEGVIGPDADLLTPAFYFSPELSRSALLDLVRRQGLSSRVLSLSQISGRLLRAAECAHRLLGLPPPSWRYARVLGALRRI